MTTATVTETRKTYGEWQASGRQVKKGQRRGTDGKFGESQTKAIGGGRRGGGKCATCGCGINYGVYCGKCEYR